MAKVFLLFILLTALIWGGLLGFQKMNGTQVFNLAKTFVYAIISSSVAVALMFMLVTIF